MNKKSKRFYHLKRALNSLIEEPSDDPLLIPQPFTHTKPLSLNPIQIYITTTKSYKTKQPKRTRIVKEVATETEAPQKINTKKRRTNNSPKKKQIHKSKSKSKPKTVNLDQQYDCFWKAKRYRRSILSLYFMKWYRKMFKKVYEKRIGINNEIKHESKNTFANVLDHNNDKGDDSFILVCSEEEEEVQLPYNGFKKVVSSISDDVIEDIFDDYIVPKKYRTNKSSNPLLKPLCLWRTRYISRVLQRDAIIDASKQSFVKQIYLPEIPLRTKLFSKDQQFYPSNDIKENQKDHHSKFKNVAEQTSSNIPKKNLKIYENHESGIQLPKMEEMQTQTSNNNVGYLNDQHNYQSSTHKFNRKNFNDIISKPNDIYNDNNYEYNDYNDIEVDYNVMYNYSRNKYPKRPKLINTNQDEQVFVEEEDTKELQYYETIAKRPKLINNSPLKNEDIKEISQRPKLIQQTNKIQQTYRQSIHNKDFLRPKLIHKNDSYNNSQQVTDNLFEEEEDFEEDLTSNSLQKVNLMDYSNDNMNIKQPQNQLTRRPQYNNNWNEIINEIRNKQIMNHVNDQLENTQALPKDSTNDKQEIENSPKYVNQPNNYQKKPHEALVINDNFLRTNSNPKQQANFNDDNKDALYSQSNNFESPDIFFSDSLHEEEINDKIQNQENEYINRTSINEKENKKDSINDINISNEIEKENRNNDNQSLTKTEIIDDYIDVDVNLDVSNDDKNNTNNNSKSKQDDLVNIDHSNEKSESEYSFVLEADESNIENKDTIKPEPESKPKNNDNNENSISFSFNEEESEGQNNETDETQEHESKEKHEDENQKEDFEEPIDIDINMNESEGKDDQTQESQNENENNKNIQNSSNLDIDDKDTEIPIKIKADLNEDENAQKSDSKSNIDDFSGGSFVLSFNEDEKENQDKNEQDQKQEKEDTNSIDVVIDTNNSEEENNQKNENLSDGSFIDDISEIKDESKDENKNEQNQEEEKKDSNASFDIEIELNESENDEKSQKEEPQNKDEILSDGSFIDDINENKEEPKVDEDKMDDIKIDKSESDDYSNNKQQDNDKSKDDEEFELEISDFQKSEDNKEEEAKKEEKDDNDSDFIDVSIDNDAQEEEEKKDDNKIEAISDSSSMDISIDEVISDEEKENETKAPPEKPEQKIEPASNQLSDEFASDSDSNSETEISKEESKSETSQDSKNDIEIKKDEDKNKNEDILPPVTKPPSLLSSIKSNSTINDNNNNLIKTGTVGLAPSTPSSSLSQTSKPPSLLSGGLFKKDTNSTPLSKTSNVSQSLPQLPSSISSRLLGSSALAPPTQKKSELREYVEKFFSPELYNDIKVKKAQFPLYPTVEVPPNVKAPWRFTKDYCDMIVDVINEMIDNTDLTDIDYETFTDKFETAMNVRDAKPDPKKKNLFPTEISDFEREENEIQQVEMIFNVSDKILTTALKSCLF